MLTQLWQFFRLPFPGTNVAIGALLFLPMVVSVAIAFLKNLFGIGGFAQIGNTAHSKIKYDKSKTKRGGK